MYKKDQTIIDHILAGGKILGEILDKLSTMAKPGVTGLDIDKEAERLILEAGGVPAFKGYRSHKNDPAFPSTICFSVNEELVHGIATKDKILKEGDVVSIDIGMQYPAKSGLGKNGNGYFTDTAVTVPVGKVSDKALQLLQVTKKALVKGIEEAKPKNKVSDIGLAVENYIKPQGYGIIRDLVGHGVGLDVHEEPRVPNYYDPELDRWILEPGVVIAIEPMVSLGDYDVETAKDGWSISMCDKSISAHFEHTVVITENGPIIATKRPSEM